MPDRQAAQAAKQALGAAAPGNQVAVRQQSGPAAFVKAIEGELVKQLPPQIPVAYFARAVLSGLRKSPQLARLAKTDDGKASIYAAMLEAARFGLVPFTEEAAIVVYGSDAVFIPQWRGLVKVMHNTGQVAAVEARMIHQHDKWRLVYGTGPDAAFVHEPYLLRDDGMPTTKEERGEPIYAYCYVRLRDGSSTAVTMLSRWEAEEIRDKYSRSYRQAENNGKHNSTWHTEFVAMWRKSAVRRNFQVAPSSPMLADLLLSAARDDVHQPEAATPPTLADMGVSDDVLIGEAVWDSDDSDGEPVPEQFDRAAAMRSLTALWQQAGVGKRTDQALRGDVAAILARADKTGPPLALRSLQDLDDDQLARLLDALRELTDGRKPDDVAAALRELVAAAQVHADRVSADAAGTGE